MACGRPLQIKSLSRLLARGHMYSFPVPLSARSARTRCKLVRKVPCLLVGHSRSDHSRTAHNQLPISQHQLIHSVQNNTLVTTTPTTTTCMLCWLVFPETRTRKPAKTSLWSEGGPVGFSHLRSQPKPCRADRKRNVHADTSPGAGSGSSMVFGP